MSTSVTLFLLVVGSSSAALRGSSLWDQGGTPIDIWGPSPAAPFSPPSALRGATGVADVEPDSFPAGSSSPDFFQCLNTCPGMPSDADAAPISSEMHRLTDAINIGHACTTGCSAATLKTAVKMIQKEEQVMLDTADFLWTNSDRTDELTAQHLRAKQVSNGAFWSKSIATDDADTKGLDLWSGPVSNGESITTDWSASSDRVVLNLTMDDFVPAAQQDVSGTGFFEDYAKIADAAGGRPADCPSGYHNTGLFCTRWSDNYHNPSRMGSCPSGYSNTGLTCHRWWLPHTIGGVGSMRCPSGWWKSPIIGRCYKNCRSGWVSTGEFCHLPLLTLPTSSMTCRPITISKSHIRQFNRGEITEEQLRASWGGEVLSVTWGRCYDVKKIIAASHTKTYKLVQEAIIEPIENFGKCFDDALNNPFLSCGLPDLAGYLNINCDAGVNTGGNPFTDGFHLGCGLPTLSVGVEFGSLTDSGKDTALLKLGAGNLKVDLTLFKRQWTESPLKDILHIDASTSIAFVNQVGLDFNGGNDWQLKLPGVRWDLDTTVALVAKKEYDPCADNEDKCRMVLNKGKTSLFTKTFMAGPVPIVVALTAEIYLKAVPKLEGSINTKVKVYLAGDGVLLLNHVNVHLSDSTRALQDLTKMVSTNVQQQIKDKLKIEITGSITAKASLQVCVGVEVGFHVNGIGVTMDLPVCMTAVLEVAANADLNAAELAIQASLTQDEIALNFAIDLPNPSTVVETVCGYVEMGTEAAGPVGQCVPVVKCFTDLADDLCDGAGKIAKEIEILPTITESVPLFDEHELWSAELTLKTNTGTTPTNCKLDMYPQFWGCPIWKRAGYCSWHPWVQQSCETTCNTCGAGGTAIETDSEGEKKKEDLDLWTPYSWRDPDWSWDIEETADNNVAVISCLQGQGACAKTSCDSGWGGWGAAAATTQAVNCPAATRRDPCGCDARSVA